MTRAAQKINLAHPRRSRYGDVDAQKASGSTYTPPRLAEFVAKKMLEVENLPETGSIRVLDPAVGDGALLEALLQCLPVKIRKRVEVWGYDTDPQAIQAASRHLEQSFPDVKVHIESKDFLADVLSVRLSHGDLFSCENQKLFDLVIANPPYVRTQVMGADQAQQLAKRFGLTGRVDLYYPFLLGISEVLKEGGVAGVITSNRFMTTKSGQSVRRALLSGFRILHAWDLGDTKLFDAAVLPSVLIAKGAKDHKHPHTGGIAFSTIYESKNTAKLRAGDVLDALDAEDDTVVELSDGRCFRVRHGGLDNGGVADGIWRVATRSTDNWLQKVKANTWDTFRRIGKIRVGVKSTADKVFIRSDWESLPTGRPELLRPLITRHCARRFKARTPAQAKQIKEILYPHEMVNGIRTAVDLSRYPRAAKYLEQHRFALESRTYVIDAGRKWYELWVPHDPDIWKVPKIVFPDISDKPVFWIDVEGGVVNGECYWLSSANEGEEDLLWLALAVANSTFIEDFYDHRFNNKLYAGRRRFITQYVEQFPLPDPERKESKTLIKMAKEIHEKVPSDEADQLASEMDALVWHIFGLGEEISR